MGFGDTYEEADSSLSFIYKSFLQAEKEVKLFSIMKNIALLASIRFYTYCSNGRLLSFQYR